MPTKPLIAASTRPLLLAILCSGESYGYAIIERVRALSDGRLQWSDGMLYPVLHRLEKEGLIVSRWRTSQAGRRRRYYAVTERGLAASREEQAHWKSVDITLRRAWRLS